jgi:ethanolamine utilization cobalamin adenosyltransferase
MGAPTYLTEDWLQQNASLTAGGELHLPADSRLTPAARDLLAARKIRVRYTDEVGRVYVDAAPGASAADPEQRQRVHPLTGSATHQAAHCLLCQQVVDQKPDAMTHLDATTLVAKNDLRIAFRGRVDSAIAQAVLLQTQWQDEAVAPTLQAMLADIRSALGNVLRCETLGETMSPIAVGDFDEAQLHTVSHNPLKHLGHDHIVPALEHGRTVARLNVLRTAIREAEVAGAQAFIDTDFTVRRGDLLQALNRLSSAVYVLMLIGLAHQKSGANS